MKQQTWRETQPRADYRQAIRALQLPSRDVDSSSQGLSRSPLPVGVAQLRDGLPQLRNDVSQLQDGVLQLREGVPQMRNDVPQLRDGVLQLPDDVSQLRHDVLQRAFESAETLRKGGKPSPRPISEQNEEVAPRKISQQLTK